MKIYFIPFYILFDNGCQCKYYMAIVDNPG